MVVLSTETVAKFALAAGDTNPIHHDPAFAQSTRYGRLIASGTHTTALVELRGRIRNQQKQTALGATGRVLVTDRL